MRKRKVPQDMPWGIVEIPVGSWFEFGNRRRYRVGDVIDFAMNYEPDDDTSVPKMGRAKVIAIVDEKYYRAERIS